MPKINASKLQECLEGLYTILKVCWELSNNQELTEHLDIAIARLEAMISTIEAAGLTS